MPVPTGIGTTETRKTRNHGPANAGLFYWCNMLESSKKVQTA